VRTCVGCRARAAKATLLRVVAVGGVLVCDPAGRLPGRGASVHRDLQCVALAEKRRAFPRALRLAGPLDVTPVREHVADHPDPQRLPDAAPAPHQQQDRTTFRAQDGPARREQAQP
jgi:hypothetical protein